MSTPARAAPPPPEGGPRRRWRHAPLAAAALPVLLTFRDFGITTDEAQLAAYGEACRRFYLSGGADRSAIGFAGGHTYRGWYWSAWSLADGLTPSAPYAGRHLANAAVGLLGVGAAGALAELVGGPAARVTAMVLLLLTPSWFGLMFNDATDIPFAAGYGWTLWCLLRVFASRKRPADGRGAVMAGTVLGLAGGVRAGVLILAPVMALAVAATPGRRLRASALAALALAIGWALMVAGTPSFCVAPWSGPLHALAALSRFPAWGSSFLFAGRMVPSTALPWWYIPHALGVTLPEPFLLGLLAAAGFAAWRVRRPGTSPVRDPDRARPLLWAAVGLPVGVAIIRHSVLYNGTRHLLFLLPPLAALAADAWTRLVVPRPPGIRRLLLLAGVSWGAWQAVSMARLHPDEYVWFNRLAGGTAAATGRYELDYYGASFREAVADLQSRYAAEAAPSRPARVMAAWNHEAVRAYLRPPLALTLNPALADFYVTGAPAGALPAGRVYAAVMRAGVPLSGVLDWRSLGRAGRRAAAASAPAAGRLP